MSTPIQSKLTNRKSPSPQRGRASKVRDTTPVPANPVIDKHLTAKPQAMYTAHEFATRVTVRDTGGAYCVVHGSGRCSGGIFTVGGFTWLPPSQARCKNIPTATLLHQSILLFYARSVARSEINVKHFPHTNAESNKPVNLPALYRIKAAACRAKASSIRSRWGSVMESVAMAVRVK